VHVECVRAYICVRVCTSLCTSSGMSMCVRMFLCLCVMMFVKAAISLSGCMLEPLGYLHECPYLSVFLLVSVYLFANEAI
jgi:hypothetical protein